MDDFLCLVFTIKDVAAIKKEISLISCVYRRVTILILSAAGLSVKSDIFHLNLHVSKTLVNISVDNDSTTSFYHDYYVNVVTFDKVYVIVESIIIVVKSKRSYLKSRLLNAVPFYTCNSIFEVERKSRFTNMKHRTSIHNNNDNNTNNNNNSNKLLDI